MSDGEEVRLNRIKGTKSVLRFALPSILMMVFTSSYTMVDGLMISNLISTDAFAGVNLAMPLFSVMTAIGFMFASGGSALVSRKMGESKLKEARSDFTFILLFGMVLALVIAVVSLIFMDPLVRLIGADDNLAPYTKEYTSILAVCAPFFIMQFITNQFLVVAGKPSLSLVMAIIAGIVNIVLDYVLIAMMDMDVGGAAIASGLSAVVPCAVAFFYFISKNCELRFCRPSMNVHTITESCYNGMSEMVSELSASISSLAFNLVMMHYLGANGVSAITIVMYIQFLSIAVIIGYAMGVAPVMGYNYGKQDRKSMSSLYKTSMLFVLAFSVTVFICMELFGEYFVRLFDTGDMDLRRIASYGLSIHAFSYLMMGVNLYVSSLFTSLSDGTRSAIISLMRGLLILVPMIVFLPMILGIEGVWLAIPITELITICFSLYILRKASDLYGYGRLIVSD